MAEPMDDRELERLMKEGLERRAETVDEGAAGALVASAREGSARRPWRTTAVMGLAAASVAGIAFATVVLTRDDGIRSGGRDVVAPNSGGPVTAWRTEYWHDTKVDVPADWGWGGAPMSDFVEVGSPPSDKVIDCGATAFMGPDGKRLLNGDGTIPYVGRPIMQTDACNGSFGPGEWPQPTAPYVWLGAPVSPGTVELADGYVMETVEVNGSTVSVATKDPALRRQILATAGGGETCLSEYDGAPSIQVVPREGVRDATGMTVCAYSEENGKAELTYATHVGAAATNDFKAALQTAPTETCQPRDVREWVLLTVEGTQGLRQEHLVQLGECSGIEVIPGGDLTSLTEATVAPWAVDGIPAYVIGPYGGKGATAGFFRGILG
jgi:hypothetical protein